MNQLQSAIELFGHAVNKVFLAPNADTWAYLKSSRVEETDEISFAFNSFLLNLTEVIDLASLPYSLVRNSEADLLFQRLRIAEQIQRLPLPGQTADEESNMREASQVASKRTLEIVSSNDFYSGETGAFHHGYISKLWRMTNDPVMRSSGENLLRLSLVTVWNAFEIFMKDSLRLFLNANPALVLRIASNILAAKKFEIKKLAIDEIAAFGFDLSERMGDILLEDRDLSDIRSMRALVESIFGDDSPLSVSLRGSDLYMLCMKRHLVVHRRGIIDKKFLAQTSVSQNIGDKLTVEPAEVSAAISLVFGVANLLQKEMVDASAEKLTGSEQI